PALPLNARPSLIYGDPSDIFTDPSVVHSLRVEPAGTWSQNSRTKLSASDLRTGSPEGVTPESQQPIAYIGVGQSFARTFLIVVWDHNPGLDGIDSAGD